MRCFHLRSVFNLCTLFEVIYSNLMLFTFSDAESLAITDITFPQRITTNAAVQKSNHFLSFTQRTHEREIRYNLTAFGKVFHFVLQPESRFIAPSFTVEHCTGNLSKSIPSGADLSHCFHHGRIDNDSTSSAVFDLCNGLVSLHKFEPTFIASYACISNDLLLGFQYFVLVM